VTKITITGHPLVLKNNKQIIVVNGRRIIKSNPRVEAYQHAKAMEIVEQIGTYFKPLTGKIEAKMIFYGAWKTGGTVPDLDNLLCLPLDLLTACGVIEDDSLVESFDGSRRVRMCDCCSYRKFKRGGGRHPDCGHIKTCRFERVEMFLDVMV